MKTPTFQIKILVVDDEPLIVEELCEFLESSGYGCVPCQSSRDAISAFTANSNINLVLCDLHMPDMDGIELTQHLQKVAGKQRAFESILLTGRSDKKDVIKALRIGIADYYQKPVDLSELLEGIQRQEEILREQHKSYQLGHLNQKLQYLAESIDDLYQDMAAARRPSQITSPSSGDSSGLQIPSIFKQLSPRQLDVAKLVSKGQTNYQIACDLGITENTVKLYVSQVLRLTHMNNRTQLALALSPNSSGQHHRQMVDG